jgi:putative oxidoreductase
VTTSSDASHLKRWSAIPLRAIVGYGFIAHGYAKVVNGADHFAASLQALGVPSPHLMAWITIGFELLGGLAVLVGAYIPLFSIPLTVILLVAAITVHLPYGFTSIKLRAVTTAGPEFGPPGYETTCSTSLPWRRWPSADRARLPSTRGFRISKNASR